MTPPTGAQGPPLPAAGRELGRPLFTFAVLSDSHVNEEEERSVSPYPSNKRANARLRWVLADIARRSPAFTVHLGDMGNPVPELPSYAAAAERFHELAAVLAHPPHLVPGNHCVGDKPTGWVPVPRVSAEALALYEASYGPPFYSFDHGPCHFTVLNSLLFNSRLSAAREQRVWLESDLAGAAAAGRRRWLLMHYPAFVAAPDEPPSYDNIDEPGRSWLLDLIIRHRVEVALSGHVHNAFVNRLAGADLYTVPATSFVRQDYSELYSVAPADAEGGRDDRAKLGYCLVTVHEHGHRLRLVRSHGRSLAPDVELDAAPELEPAERPVGPPAPLAVEMRENWLAPQHLRTNNSVSPFTRRLARNDWAVWALEEAGVRRVRLAAQELGDPQVRARMAALGARGFEFLAYSSGAPGRAERELARRSSNLLAGWELILPLDGIEETAAKLAGFGGGVPLHLSELRDVERAQLDDANVKHQANYGFQLHEDEKIERLCISEAVRAAFAGLVFRLRRRGEPETSPWTSIAAIAELGRRYGVRNQAHILFSGSLTAERMTDDRATANRVAESALAAVATGVEVCFDTFEDTDRGYFVRHGLVDRSYDPRPAARVLTHLNAALACWGGEAPASAGASDLHGGRLASLRFGGRLLAALLPAPRLELEEIELSGASGDEPLLLIDLESGASSSPKAKVEGVRLCFDPPLVAEQPSLLITAAEPPAAD